MRACRPSRNKTQSTIRDARRNSHSRRTILVSGPGRIVRIFRPLSWGRIHAQTMVDGSVRNVVRRQRADARAAARNAVHGLPCRIDRAPVACLPWRRGTARSALPARRYAPDAALRLLDAWPVPVQVQDARRPAPDRTAQPVGHLAAHEAPGPRQATSRRTQGCRYQGLIRTV